MMRYVSAALRRLVADRAFERCEYCRLPQSAAIAKHHIEHIVPLKHGGRTTEENRLWLARFAMNRKARMSARSTLKPTVR